MAAWPRRVRAISPIVPWPTPWRRRRSTSSGSRTNSCRATPTACSSARSRPPAHLPNLGRSIARAAAPRAPPRQARDAALQAGQQARDRATEAGQQAGAQVLQSTRKTGRRARARIEDAVPAAKAALLEKLAMDERVMERARAALSKNKLFAPAAAPPARRSFPPWGLLLALLGGAAVGAGLKSILDPGIGGWRRASVNEHFGYARRRTAQTLARASAQVRDRASSSAPGSRQPPNCPQT